MKSIPEFLLGKRLFLVVGLLSLFYIPAVEAQEWQKHPSFANSYYGNVYDVPVDETGVPDSLVPVVSDTNIARGSYGMALGDFDNDGLADYLIGGRSTSTGKACIELHLSLGAPLLFANDLVVTPEGWSVCDIVSDFAVADFDLDGNLDFSVNDTCGKKVHIFFGKGDGTFQETDPLSLPFQSFGLDTEDVDGDGLADLVAVNWYGHPAYNKLPVEVFLNDGTGGFSQQTLLLDSPYTRSFYPVSSRGIALGDFDGDGFPDLVTSPPAPEYRDKKMLVFNRGRGDGTFGQTPLLSGEVSESVVAGYVEHGGLAKEDVNDDGYPDLIAANYMRGDVLVYFGKGDGTFEVAVSGAEHAMSGGSLTGMATLPLSPVNHKPQADAGGPYFVVTDDVFLVVNPRTLNMDSNGNWVKASIESDPEGDAIVTLDGTRSEDPDGDELSYAWTVRSKMGDVYTRGGSQPVLELPAGSYTVELVVSDGQDFSDVLPVAALEVVSVDVSHLGPHDLFLNGIPASVARPNETGLVAKFPRREFNRTLEPGTAVSVELTGTVHGYDEIKVIGRAK